LIANVKADVPDWAAGAASFTGFAESNVNTPAILNTYDSSYMTDFFRNPDGMGDQFGDWLVNQPNIKMDGSGFAHLPNFEPTSHNVTTPPVTPGGHGAQHPLNHTTHAQHMPMASHVPAYMEHDVIDGGSYLEENALSAASGLYQMHRVGRQPTSISQPTAQHINGAIAGGNWSSVEVGHQMMGGEGQQGGQYNLQSPLTPSGRQPSNSYHSLPQQPHPLHADYVPRSQHWQTAWLDSQQQAVPGARYPAQPQSNQQFDIYPSAFTGGAMSSTQSAQQRSYSGQRPTEMPFGTDINFTGRHYHPPRGSIPREDEKGSNLNNVPFAGELAARGHSHAHPVTSSPISHPHQRHNLPTYANFLQTQTSPAIMGGLPATSSLTSSHRGSIPVSDMARGKIESLDPSDDDGDFEEEQPRKRRKSQAQREDDEEYTPTGHMKTPNPKRGPKAARSGDGADDDSSDHNHTATSSRSKPTKRRKMSATGRASPGSQEYGTPRINESESPEPSSKSASKKKSRAASQASKSNNLTEEEKRQNHIRSEKTRRDLIKWQYDALDDLVPGLKSGKSGLSRADVLLEIVGYVENVKLGNEKMEEILASWNAGGGAAPGGDYG
jgi:hypothetical protein